MGRPKLFVCTRCDGGDELYEAVRALRKDRGVKEEIKVVDVRCLDMCGDRCAIRVEKKHGGSTADSGFRPKDAAAVLDRALAYARD